MDINNIPKSGWIWVQNEDYHSDLVQFVYFRKEFVLDTVPAEMKIDVSADSRYKLYVNGQILEVGPEKGDNKVWFYETVDIAPALHEGKNVVAAIVLRYPLEISKGNHGVWRTNTPGLYIKSETLTADETWKYLYDDKITIVSESKWFAPLQIFENAAGNTAAAGFMNEDFDDSSWKNAKPYSIFDILMAISPGNLYPRRIPSLYQRWATFTGVMKKRAGQVTEGEWNSMLLDGRPVTIAPNSVEVVEINAGEEMTGFTNLRLAGGKGAQINILYSECYSVPLEEGSTSMHGNQPIKGDRTDCEHNVLYGFADDYEVAGYGTEGKPEVYEPFWFRTFRFVKLTVKTGSEPVRILGYDYRETGYPLEVNVKPKCDDEMKLAIWDISIRSLRRCMHETYEDCPFYEQLQYLMDSRAQMLYTYKVSGDDRLARKCMDDFGRSARHDGMLNCCYPSFAPNIIPGFSIYFILMVYDHMTYFHDEELVRTYMPTIDGILEYFRKNLDERGIVAKTGSYNGQGKYWSFIDWVPEWRSGVPNANSAGPITMESFLYIYGLQHAAKLCEYLNRNDMAKEYLDRASKVQEAVRKYCVGKKGLFRDGPGFEEYSQQPQVFAVLTDTVDVAEGRRLLTEVLDNPYPKCTVAMMFYMFRALEKVDMYDRTEALWEPWRKMIADHVTTCVENDIDARSDCHAWGALMLYEMPYEKL